MRTYGRQPVTLVRGDGAYVWDDKGNQYLDFLAGVAVNALGHCHPALVEALTQQARTLIHTSNIYYTVPQLQLAEVLLQQAGLDRIFYCNSGAEAMEACIKLARKYGKERKGGAYEIIVTEGAFHGRTIATVTATANPHYSEPFAPLPGGFPRVPYNDLDAVKRAVTDQTVGVMVELVQGEGGVWPADKAYVQGLRQLCDERGLLLILDEVQTGIGRLGSFYGYQQYGITPDIMGLAKQLGGGLPIGACLATEQASVFVPGDHGSTFSGSPLVCAGALAVVNTILQEDLVGNARRVGAHLLDGLRGLAQKHALAEGARGLGLLVALQLTQDRSRDVVAAALTRGLLVNPVAPSTVRLAPPLIITTEQADRAVAILDECLAELA
jgi:acetylornithine aminotransferase/acetylornithine/N-succinyldiaminopimelate aminotransferase